MSARDHFGLLAVVAVLVVGLGLKTARYAHGAVKPGVSAEARISQFMAHEGWAPTGPKSARAGDLYDWLEFARAGCSWPVTIGFLGANTENGDLFRRDHAGDAAFLQEDQILIHPSGFARQISALGDALHGVVGAPAPARLPLIAISPAPIRSPAPASRSTIGPEPALDPCRGPSVGAWQSLEIMDKP
jgi:hypothetical protein